MRDLPLNKVIEKSLSAGINEHLAKPINPELLYATLEKFIGKNK